MLHLPDLQKNKIEFRKIINERFTLIDTKLKEINSNEHSEDEILNAINELSYDFRYAFFPPEIHFNGKTFKVFADFGWTTFKYVLFNFSTFEKGANFTSAKFTQDAVFNKSTFNCEIRFDSAKFIKEANFSRTTINNDIHFDECVFKGKANFLLAKFDFANKKSRSLRQQISAQSSFSKAKFGREADFRHSHFFSQITFFKAEFSTEASFRYTKFYNDTNFKWMKFAGDTFFDKCKFRDFVDFSSSIFASNSDVFFRNTIFYQNIDFGYVTFASFVKFESHKRRSIFSNESVVNFQNVRNESSAKVAFNQVVLRPCWFIKVDSTN